MSIFANESNFKNDIQREKLLEKLGMEADSGTAKVPVMIQLINALTSGKGIGLGKNQPQKK